NLPQVNSPVQSMKPPVQADGPRSLLCRDVFPLLPDGSGSTGSPFPPATGQLSDKLLTISLPAPDNFHGQPSEDSGMKRTTLPLAKLPGCAFLLAGLLFSGAVPIATAGGGPLCRSGIVAREVTSESRDLANTSIST